MPETVSTLDIARAAGVSRRSVQLFLKRTSPTPEDVRGYRIPVAQMPAIVEAVQKSRKRRRSNANTRQVSQ